MSSSSKLCKKKLIQYILENISRKSRILDVGVGEGTYSNLLSPLGYDNMEAIEIFEPYITKYDLKNKYKKVNNTNALDFNYANEKYDLVILGDILEHLDEEQAHHLLNILFSHTNRIIVSVPYNSVQGKANDNVYEIHLQSALNKEKFEKLYPDFKCICEEKYAGEHISVWVWENLKPSEVKENG